MSITAILPIVSTIIMFAFAAYVLQRYYLRRRLSYLFWGLGLAMFGIGSMSELLLTFGWSDLFFFTWYLFGAVLTAAWIGQGTVHLLAKKKLARISTVVLVVASIVVAIMLLRTMPDLNTAIFNPDQPVSEQYREIMPPISEGGFVRLTTPIFNVYGLITLVGGALWSSYLFWRKRVLPNRVVGNVLIAVGALIIASASTLTRLGYGQFLYAGELLAGILMFAGFLVAAAPRSEGSSDETAPAATSV